MKARLSTISQLAATRGFAIVLLVASIVLLYFVLVTFKDTPTTLPSLNEGSAETDQLVPIKQIEELSAELVQPPLLEFGSGNHPFFTTHFKAPPKPPEKPAAPPAPLLKKVPLYYHGLYKTADGSQQVFLKVEGQLKVLSMGAKVLKEWSVAEATPKQLTLTNPAVAEPAILEFNREKILEVQEDPPAPKK